MKFIKLESRGGNYLVVAENVAWLRSAENGQTNVGIIGGQPLLVVGTIEQVADKILKGVNGEDMDEAPAPPPEAQPAAPDSPQVVSPPAPESERQVEVTQESIPASLSEAPEPETEPVPVQAETAEPEPESEPDPAAADVDVDVLPEPAPLPEPIRLQPRPAASAPARPRPAADSAATRWEHPVAAPVAKGLKIKAGSQRMMGMLE